MSPSLNTYSTAALAYLGDCVLEICVREHLVKLGLASSARLNKSALDFVRAPCQAEAMKRILPHLSEEEKATFKRAFNSGHLNRPKHASLKEYRTATGFEAVIGMLAYIKDEERVEQLLDAAHKITGGNENDSED